MNVVWASPTGPLDCLNWYQSMTESATGLLLGLYLLNGDFDAEVMEEYNG